MSYCLEILILLLLSSNFDRNICVLFTVKKNLSRRLRYDLVQLEGNSRSSTSLKKVR